MSSESKLNYIKISDSKGKKKNKTFTLKGSNSPVVLAFEKSVANSEPKFALKIIFYQAVSINNYP